MTQSTAYLVLRSTITIVLLLAAAEKLRNVSSFRQIVEQYKLLPTRVVPAASGTIIAAEVCVALLLVLGLAMAAAWLIAIGLFSLFTIAIAINLVRKNRVPCGCFGGIGLERISITVLSRALILSLLSLVGFAIGGLTSPPRPPISAFIPSLMLAATGVLAIRLCGLVGQTWSYLWVPGTVPPTGSHRVSFKDQPLNRSLRGPVYVSTSKSLQPDDPLVALEGEKSK